MTLSDEERRFVTDTIRNVIFDMKEDDEDKWWAAVGELTQALETLGESLDDSEAPGPD